MEYYYALGIGFLCLLAVIILYNIVLLLLLRGDRLRAQPAALLEAEAEAEAAIPV